MCADEWLNKPLSVDACSYPGHTMVDDIDLQPPELNCSRALDPRRGSNRVRQDVG